jgi:hypothetical protein
MGDAVMREPYEVLECTRCGDRLTEDQLPFGLVEFTIGETSREFVDTLNRYHRRAYVFGGCGPVERRTVGLQEQFVEWLGGGDAR